MRQEGVQVTVKYKKYVAVARTCTHAESVFPLCEVLKATEFKLVMSLITIVANLQPPIAVGIYHCIKCSILLSYRTLATSLFS